MKAAEDDGEEVTSKETPAPAQEGGLGPLHHSLHAACVLPHAAVSSCAFRL
jgi:hypothetical protein